MRVYLDNCAYNRPFDDQSQIRIALESQAKMYIQGLIVGKKIELACSYMSRYENNANPHKEHRHSITDFFNHAVEYVGYEKAEAVETRTQEIMKYRIKYYDALHIACAVESRCDCFITTDDGILQKYKGDDIQMCNPLDFIRYMEEKYA
jgi:predicted nucleic acid-binding protein